MNKYKISDKIATRCVDDDLFVFNRKTGRIHVFNSTAQFIWTYLQNNENIDTITTKIIDEYQVSEKEAKADLIEFLTILNNKELISLNE